MCVCVCAACACVRACVWVREGGGGAGVSEGSEANTVPFSDFIGCSVNIDTVLISSKLELLGRHVHVHAGSRFVNEEQNRKLAHDIII